MNRHNIIKWCCAFSGGRNEESRRKHEKSCSGRIRQRKDVCVSELVLIDYHLFLYLMKHLLKEILQNDEEIKIKFEMKFIPELENFNYLPFNCNLVGCNRL